MSACKCVFFCLSTLFVFSLVQSTEFVPCFIWSSKRTSDRVPALNKISQDIFKEGIQKFLKDDSVDLIVIFAEQTLSPEDFAQHDQSGIIFSNLAKLSKTTKVSYLPYVQNPIKALKHLDIAVTEVPLDKLGKGFEIPETDILIVNLNDAKDNENRNEMLKRHDIEVSLLFQELTKSHKNILCIYTAHHTSWVASEEVVQSRQRRSLLADAEETARAEAKEEKAAPRAIVNGPPFFSGDKYMLYETSFKYRYANNEYNATNLDFEATENTTGVHTILLAGTATGTYTIKFNMTFTTSFGYWKMENIVPTIISNSTSTESLNLTSGSIIEAPNSFSFHCGDQVLADPSGLLRVTIKDFQIELLFNSNTTNVTKFHDAYDCVGFTSVPIWSGLFVTTILLIIMTLGITMMMDIRTMDKFDDAKGKTITINAE